ncbi:CHAT domain-containing tetratricopeptide repeat protein [Flavobacterium sp. PL12]|uniref:CHAT domain-containing protein n=1 Tax=Flavobacterium sp. PL12 TaxID=3071718 RepID=UPI00319E28B7
MEVLKLQQFTKNLRVGEKNVFYKWKALFNGSLSSFQNIFILIVFIFSGSISAQKTNTFEEKINLNVDRFTENPTAENLKKLEAFDKNISHSINSLKDKNELLAFVILKSNLGYYQNQLNKKQQAISNYEKAWQIYQKNRLSNYDIIEYCLKPLGNLYTIIGDFDNAENIIKQYYYIATQTNNLQQQYAAVLNLSNVYQNTGRINDAIALLEKTIRSQNLTDLQKGNLYNNLGSNYFLNTNSNKIIPNDYENAEKAFLKAISLLEKGKSQNMALANTYRNLSKLKLQRNDAKMALVYFEKARNLFNKNSSIDPRSKSEFLFDEANLLFKTGKLKESAVLITQIFKNLIPSFDNKKTDLPNKNIIYADTMLLDAFDLQAAIYTIENQPEKALECYGLSFHIEELFQSLLVYENSKIISQLRNRNRTEKCIAIYESLYQKDNQITHLENAFLLAEKTKSAVLKQVLLNSSKQSTLQKKIAQQLQNESNLILKEQQKGDLADIVKINNSIKKQNELMLQLKQSASETESNPNSGIILSDLYAKLEKDNAIMVEYFSGINKMYSFAIASNKIYLNSFNNNAHVSVKIVQFIDFFNDANTIANSPADYNKYSNMAYKLLKLPVNSAYKNLLIVPDGLLNFLPFEALITKESATTNFAKMNYLLNDYNIGYQNSAQFYLEANRAKRKPVATVLGIFPIFKKTPFELTFSKDEMQSIKEKFKGKYFDNSSATFGNFKNNANLYSILHLSTHASSGDIDSPASIKFSDQEVMYSELYHLNIHPDLVVLSACETGIGKLFKSEGAMSIARGFQFAGAQNLLFSLWKVNDYTTSLFMDLFYKNIKENQSYIEANANAKRDFLKNKTISNAKKSPYYWSALVYYGNIEKPPSTNYLVYGLIILLGIGLFISSKLFLSKKKRRS